MADKEDDDLYESVTKMADRLKLKGKDRGTYVHEHMTRGGYRAVPNYVKDDGDDDDDESGSPFFGGKRKGSGSGSSSRRRRSNDDDDDW